MKIGFTQDSNTKKSPMYIAMSSTGSKFEVQLKEDGNVKINRKNATPPRFCLPIFKSSRFPVVRPGARTFSINRETRSSRRPQSA